MPEDTDYYNSYPQPHGAPSPASQPADQAASQEIRMKDTEDGDEEEQRIHERTEVRHRAQQAEAEAEAKGGAPPMKIRENYVPLAAAKAANRPSTALCPNCNQQIPFSELDEHMRSRSLPTSTGGSIGS